MDFSYGVAQISQLDKIMEIYSSAQRFMESNGNPQWGRGFPDKRDITEGIFGGIIYTVTSKGEIAALFSVVNYDGNYDIIEGEWLTSGNYLAVHRVAVAENFRGTGAAKYIVNTAAKEIARLRGRTSIRMDTHEKNAPMLKLLHGMGFTECGIVTLARDLTYRIAFEKVL